MILTNKKNGTTGMSSTTSASKSSRSYGKKNKYVKPQIWSKEGQAVET